jgi:hypothetical protein
MPVLGEAVPTPAAADQTQLNVSAWPVIGGHQDGSTLPGPGSQPLPVPGPQPLCPGYRDEIKTIQQRRGDRDQVGTRVGDERQSTQVDPGFVGGDQP